jgi:hypothetical protein
MLCPHCRSQRPDAEPFCLNCGRPFYLGVASNKRRPSSAILDRKELLAREQPPAEPPEQPRRDRWQYIDVVIPLGLEAPTGGRDFPKEFKARFEQLVQEVLGRARQDGWQPAEPTGLRALGPEKFATSRSGWLKVKLRYDSVTIRLKRPRPG